MGGCRSTDCHRIAKSIWQWCEANMVYLFATYIPTGDNTVADKASRLDVDKSDFGLHDQFFESIVSEFGQPQIDLFATEITTKCEKFISWYPCPGAFSIDAFTVKWNDYFYAFPPFILITRVLRKILNEKATGIVVVPKWNTQPWYPIFMSLTVSSIITLGPSSNMLYYPYYDRHKTEFPKDLVLMSAILSGKC